MSKLTGRQSRLIFYLVLCFLNAVLSIVTGVLQNCVALIADAFAQFAGVIALVIGLASVRLSSKPPNDRYTYGYQRADLVGALANAAFLCGLCFGVALKAIGHFLIPDQIDRPELVLYVGIVGLCVNLIGFALTAQFSGHFPCCNKKEKSGVNNSGKHNQSQSVTNGAFDLAGVDNVSEEKAAERPNHEHQEDVVHNDGCLATDREAESTMEPEAEVKRSKVSSGMKAVLLSVLCDALGSFVVIVVALIEMLAEAGWTPIMDPLLTLITVAVILIQTFALLRELIFSLMDATPTDINTAELVAKLCSIPGVVSVHELHIRTLQSNVIVATAHLTVESVAESSQIHVSAKRLFHDQSIHSTTIQLEALTSATQAERDRNQNQNQRQNLSCSIPCVAGAMCRSMSCCTIVTKCNTNGNNGNGNGASADSLQVDSSNLDSCIEIPNQENLADGHSALTD